MVINQEKMRALYGADDRTSYTDKEVVELIEKRVKWLTTHNKNYNQAQWVYLQDIEDMLDAIEW